MIKKFNKFQNSLWEAAIALVGAEGTEQCQQTAIELQALIERSCEFRALEMASYRPFRKPTGFEVNPSNIKAENICTPQYWITKAENETQ